MQRQFLILIFFVVLLSCNNENNHKLLKVGYDTIVIQSLSKYDSIKNLVIQNIKRFNFNNAYTYTYYYTFDDNAKIVDFPNDSLPINILADVKEIIHRLGKNYFFGFTISKDSCLEILIRNTYIQTEGTDIRERLYWRQCRTSQNNPNICDTLISIGWRYSIWKDKRTDF